MQMDLPVIAGNGSHADDGRGVVYRLPLPFDPADDEHRSDFGAARQRTAQPRSIERGRIDQRMPQEVALQIAFREDCEIDALPVTPSEIGVQTFNDPRNIAESRLALEGCDPQSAHRTPEIDRSTLG